MMACLSDYTPSTPELMLGIAGVTIAMTLVAIGARMLKVLPASLEDSVEAS